jgi:predicted DNA-binding ribbon-helix-helix protein
LLKKAENSKMLKKKDRNFRLEPWIYDAIDEMAQEKGLTFTDVVNSLLGSELDFMGYSKAQYDAKTYGLGRGKEKAEERRREA